MQAHACQLQSDPHSDPQVKPLELIEIHFVDVTPAPFFTALCGGNDGMAGRGKVRAGVSILRRIAASDVSTFETHAKVNPCISQFQTVLAAF